MDIIARPEIIASGLVELFSVDKSGNELEILGRFANTVQLEGYDALGQIMSGNLVATINAMYFQIAPSPGTSRSPVGTNYTHASFSGLTGSVDYVRNQITPAILSGASGATSNRATFVGVLSSGTAGILGNHTFANNSVIEVAALAVSPDFANDATKDLIYAAYTPVTPIAPAAGSGIGIRWQIRFAPV